MSKNCVILHPEQTNFIWRLSFLCTISSFYAFLRGYNDLALAVIGVFFTSINVADHVSL